MAEKDKMVDFPHYDPDRRIPFPPGPNDQSPFGAPVPRKKEEAAPKVPYHQSYDPDPVTPDPSQTSPGQPDIRNPHTKLPEDTDLSKLSPNVDHKL